MEGACPRGSTKNKVFITFHPVAKDKLALKNEVQARRITFESLPEETPGSRRYAAALTLRSEGESTVYVELPHGEDREFKHIQNAPAPAQVIEFFNEHEAELNERLAYDKEINNNRELWLLRMQLQEKIRQWRVCNVLFPKQDREATTPVIAAVGAYESLRAKTRRGVLERELMELREKVREKRASLME